MEKQLHELSKKELISIIQDYQEIVSEIEHKLNTSVNDNEFLHLDIRAILDKYL